MKIMWKCQGDQCKESCCGRFSKQEKQYNKSSLSVEGINHKEIPVSNDDLKNIELVKYINGSPYIDLLEDGTCPYFKSGLCSIYKHRPLACRIYPFYIDQFSGLSIDKNCNGIGCGEMEQKDIDRIIEDIRENDRNYDLRVETINFGEHLMIDGYLADEKKLDSEEAIRDVFKNILELTGMTMLAPPYIVRAEDNQIKDPGGYTGYQLIKESHISVHTFPKRRFISIDVYTCRDGLDIDGVISVFKETFGIGEVEVNFVKRGTRYPKENIA